MPARAPLRVWSKTGFSTECRSCHAKMTMYQLISGKWHPFDGDPVFLRTGVDANSGEPTAEIDPKDSHFATCPNSKSWSRK